MTEFLLLPIPTVALINGTGVGGGCELASACDFRIAEKGLEWICTREISDYNWMGWRNDDFGKNAPRKWVENAFRGETL